MRFVDQCLSQIIDYLSKVRKRQKLRAKLSKTLQQLHNAAKSVISGLLFILISFF